MKWIQTFENIIGVFGNDLQNSPRMVGQVYHIVNLMIWLAIHTIAVIGVGEVVGDSAAADDFDDELTNQKILSEYVLLHNTFKRHQAQLIWRINLLIHNIKRNMKYLLKQHM